MVHVGIGYDVHALVAGRKLILGGVEIPHTKGLDGHSDADALMHAICDARSRRARRGGHRPFFPEHRPALERRAQQGVSGRSRQAGCEAQRQNRERGRDHHRAGSPKFIRTLPK